MCVCVCVHMNLYVYVNYIFIQTTEIKWVLNKIEYKQEIFHHMKLFKIII